MPHDDQNERNMEWSVSGVVTDAPVLIADAVNAIGQVVAYKDGRVFRYISTAVDIEAGEIAGQVTGSAIVSNQVQTSGTPAALPAIGDTSVTLALAAITANQFAGGYMFTTDDTGQGYTYRIKSNTLTASSNIILTLYDDLIIALDATTDIQLIPNLYSLAVLGTLALDPIGVAVRATTAGTDSTTQAFWVQVKGPVAVRVENSTTLAIGITVGGGAAGGVVVKTATNALIGVCISAAEDASGFQPVDLKIAAKD